MMPQISETVFNDIPLSFNAHPVTGNVKLLTNADAIKQSVKNIVLTNFYERPYNPFFGGDVTSQLFENMTPITEYNVSKNIRQALKNYEPRAIVDDVIVNSNEDLNSLNVTIIFRLRNSSEPIAVNVLLERVR